MRFSVFLTFHDIDPALDGENLFADHLEQAVLADRLGYDGISIPEHPLVHLIKAPHALINAVAIGQHVKCDVGVAIIILPLHHPLAIAGQIAEADQALGGRLVLGVGRGAYRYEFDRYGVDFNSSRARMSESLDILEKIWHSPDAAVNYEGEFWSFADTYVWPRPKQRPHPPVWVAGQTAATIEWAVDRGYNVLNALMRRPDTVVEDVARVFHDRREAVSLERGEISLGISRPTFVTTDRDKVRKRIEENQTLHKIHTHMHNFTEHADKRSYVPPLDVPDLPSAEEIETGILLGPAERILERVERYHELGIDELVVGMGYGAPQSETLESLQDFAENVIAPYRRAHGLAAVRDNSARITTERAGALHRPERIEVRVATAGETVTSYVTSKAWFKLALHKTGSGPAVMVVHDSAASSASLAELTGALAAQHTVYVLDRRGRGASADDTIGSYGLTREAETDIVQALNSVPEQVVLIWHGYGAALVVRAATLGQTPLLGLALCAGGAEEPADAAERLVDLARRVDDLLAAGRDEDAVTTYLTEVTGLGAGELQRLSDRPDWSDRVAAAGTIARELRELAAFRHVPERLANITMPTLVVSGEQLPSGTRTALRGLADALPNASFEEIDNAGRLAPELHAEAVATTFTRFVAACGSVPAAG
jgi:alkanesulfonate monooxygenase SsuD/methylene tetrahydromethanopterin reductase-like flavin-dependent oxidoreductase (luciferase family)/pimeloyl-ACP methyl ester carboxylesterase